VAGERSVLPGLLLYVLLVVAPTVLFWVALRVLPAAATSLADRRRARRPRPLGPPLEQLVADARRLRREVCREVCRPPRTHVRRVALLQAYDEALLDLCRVLGVTAPALDRADRAFARLQVEAAVEAAGVALDVPPPDTARPTA
jgi:hypothetical protein